MSQRHQIVAEHFDEAARYWNDIYQYTDVYSLIYQERRTVIRDMIQRLRLPAGARVLEVGCGAGHTAIEIAEMGYRVEAVDCSSSMIESTLANARQAGVAGRVRARQADIYTLDAPAEGFHLVVAIGVLPWLDSLEDPVQSLARAAAPGGHVITTVDHRWGWNRVLDPRVNPLILGAKTVARRTLEIAGLRQTVARARTHSTGELDRALLAAGLQKQEGLTLGFGPFTFWNRNLLSDERGVALHKRLQARANAGQAPYKWGGAQYIVCAQKNHRRNSHAN